MTQEEIMMTIADHLYVNKISGRECARRAGLYASHVSDFIGGRKTNIQINTLIKILDAVGLEIDIVRKET